MSFLPTLEADFPIGTPVRVTYIFEGESYFFDGEVTNEVAPYNPRDGVVIGYVTDYSSGIPQNVYIADTVESLESLHTPKES